MTSEEFTLWTVKDAHEPQGPRQMMLMLAEVLAAVANGALTRRDKQAWEAAHFLPPDPWQVLPASAAPAAPTATGPSLDELQRAMRC